jgi:hypothetical protein
LARLSAQTLGVEQLAWKLIALWIALGTVTAPLTGGLFGAVAAIINSGTAEDLMVTALAGALAVFATSVGLTLAGLPIMCITVMSWVILVRRFPKLEVSALRLAASLGSFTMAILGAALLAIPNLETPFSMLLAVLFLAAVGLPRAITEALRPGVFAA